MSEPQLFSIEERSKWFFERYTFEQFAMDHDLHKHCIGCAGCILDPQPIVQYSHPIWCVACRDRIEKVCAMTGRKPPWEFTMTFRSGGAVDDV
jgi:hypothetical protein